MCFLCILGFYCFCLEFHELSNTAFCAYKTCCTGRSRGRGPVLSNRTTYSSDCKECLWRKNVKNFLSWGCYQLHLLLVCALYSCLLLVNDCCSAVRSSVGLLSHMHFFLYILKKALKDCLEKIQGNGSLCILIYWDWSKVADENQNAFLKCSFSFLVPLARGHWWS